MLSGGDRRETGSKRRRWDEQAELEEQQVLPQAEVPKGVQQKEWVAGEVDSLS